MISDSENSKAQYKTAIKVARKGAESTRINSRDLSVKVTFEPAKKKKDPVMQRSGGTEFQAEGTASIKALG